MTDVTDDLRLSIEHVHGPLAVAAVTGDLDLHTSPVLRARALEVVQQGHPRLILDLTDVGFCDSTGLSVLIGIWHTANDAGGSLTLAGVPSRLTRMLAVTGVDALLPSYPTVSDALAAHTAGPAASTG
ncbi:MULTISPECIES: STAS domain-containing protein [Streptomyces]|uniref:Anti-sigma factor antagonist n=1 Tax=Streptomyces desertarenae TaxID=2666184 RepID=A0ABW4PQJ5_9ACTN